MDPVPARKKTFVQVESIKEVQRAAEKAMESVIAYLRSTEQPTSEGAHEVIDAVLEEKSCESPEGHIVAGSTQSAEPHALGTGRLSIGVPIVIDIFPRSKATRYFADMSRTLCIGQPPPELQKMYAAVLAAQELAISMLKPGTQCSDIQETVEKFFREAGYVTSGKGTEFPFAEGFVHGVGHGVGLEVHEPPRIGRGSVDVLQEGDVVTAEPGLYYEALGGVRLEDMLLITKNGSENLTDFPKQLAI